MKKEEWRMPLLAFFIVYLNSIVIGMYATLAHLPPF